MNSDVTRNKVTVGVEACNGKKLTGEVYFTNFDEIRDNFMFILALSKFTTIEFTPSNMPIREFCNHVADVVKHLQQDLGITPSYALDVS